MSYISTQQLIDRFSELELIQLTGGTDAIVADVLNSAIADSDAEIDDYLRERYPLPLLSVSASIERLAADITRFYLYADAVTPIVEMRYTNALALLKAIASGRVSLPDECINNPAGEALAGGISVRAESTVFTTDVLTKMAL